MRWINLISILAFRCSSSCFKHHPDRAPRNWLSTYQQEAVLHAICDCYSSTPQHVVDSPDERQTVCVRCEHITNRDSAVCLGNLPIINCLAACFSSMVFNQRAEEREREEKKKVFTTLDLCYDSKLMKTREETREVQEAIDPLVISILVKVKCNDKRSVKHEEGRRGGTEQRRLLLAFPVINRSCPSRSSNHLVAAPLHSMSTCYTTRVMHQ